MSNSAEHPPLPSYAEAYARGLKEGIEIGEASRNLVILDLEKEVNRLKTVLGTFRVLVDSYEQTPTTYVRHYADQDEASARGSAPSDPRPVGQAGSGDPRHERTDSDDPEEASQEEGQEPEVGTSVCVNGTVLSVED